MKIRFVQITEVKECGLRLETIWGFFIRPTDSRAERTSTHKTDKAKEK